MLSFIKSVEEVEFEKAKKILGPKPESAPNRILAYLFAHP
jgi:hypothetical protein